MPKTIPSLLYNVIILYKPKKEKDEKNNLR